MPGPTGYNLPTPGIVANDMAPQDGQLYATPEEMQALFGVTATAEQLRFAQALVNTTCCRKSLWVEEYFHRLPVPNDRQMVQLPVTPVVQLLQMEGRYSYGRRDRRSQLALNSDYVAAMAIFGSPPRMVAIDTAQVDVFPATGQVWLPTGFFLIGYSEISVRYMAGYANIPHRVKAALAEVLNEMCQRGSSSRTRYSVGRVSREFRTDGFVSKVAYGLLEPYIAVSYQ